MWLGCHIWYSGLLVLFCKWGVIQGGLQSVWDTLFCCPPCCPWGNWGRWCQVQALLSIFAQCSIQLKLERGVQNGKVSATYLELKAQNLLHGRGNMTVLQSHSPPKTTWCQCPMGFQGRHDTGSSGEQPVQLTADGVFPCFSPSSLPITGQYKVLKPSVSTAINPRDALL